jgi:hypothetical protein
MKESIHAIIMYYMGDDSVVSKSWCIFLNPQ